MPPSTSHDPEILVDEMRQKFLDILKSDGITDEVENLIMINPPELKGEHMASASAYVRVEFKDPSKKPKNLFVKKYTNNPVHTEMVKLMQIMEKETEFFMKFLPATQEFCKNFPGCENLIDFFPKCLYGDSEMVVLENVVLDDTFVMLPKEEYQDIHTTRHVLTNLAKFHAATYSFIEETGREEFQKKWPLVISECFVAADKNPFVEQMYDNGTNMCINIMKGYEGEGKEETIEKLTAYLGKAYGIVKNLLIRKPENKIWVVNHGDCWNNNMLFKVDSESGKVVDHIFIDMQITRLGSPCLDLGYYLYTSVKPAVRRAHLKELLQHYFDQFKTTVESFNLSCPSTFEEFFEDYREKCNLGFFTGLTVLSALGAMKDVDMDASTENEEDMMNMFMEVVNNWLANNPDKVEKIAKELISVVREHDAFINQQ